MRLTETPGHDDPVMLAVTLPRDETRACRAPRRACPGQRFVTDGHSPAIPNRAICAVARSSSVTSATVHIRSFCGSASCGGGFRATAHADESMLG
jgi:hypothetical protein